MVQDKSYIPLFLLNRRLVPASYKDSTYIYISQKEAKKSKKIPLLIKISPDIADSDLENICDIALKEKWLDGIIVSNTTTTREPLKNKPIKKQSDNFISFEE